MPEQLAGADGKIGEKGNIQEARIFIRVLIYLRGLFSLAEKNVIRENKDLGILKIA